jgi:hypothetical protein
MILVKDIEEREKLPYWAQGGVKFPKGTYEDYSDQPDEVILLGETAWPDKVKQKIVKILEAHGIKDPLNHKLVEPHAIVFGGRDRNTGVYDLSKVNWEKLVDYFEYETTVKTANDPAYPNAVHRIGVLQRKSMRKFKCTYTHRGMYGDEG